MPATLAERVTRLEDEVGYLKTWSGPGQIQAILDGQREFRGDLAKMDAGLGKVHARLDKMDARLDKMDARLDKMDARLDRHEQLLTGLTTEVLGLKDSMAEVLRRLPLPEK